MEIFIKRISVWILIGLHENTHFVEYSSITNLISFLCLFNSSQLSPSKTNVGSFYHYQYYLTFASTLVFSEFQMSFFFSRTFCRCARLDRLQNAFASFRSKAPPDLADFPKNPASKSLRKSGPWLCAKFLWHLALDLCLWRYRSLHFSLPSFGLEHDTQVGLLYWIHTFAVVKSFRHIFRGLFNHFHTRLLVARAICWQLVINEILRNLPEF